jgi:hypothetical protein
MPAVRSVALDHMFGSVAGSLIVQQQRLDARYLADCAVFEEWFRKARDAALAAQLVPAHMVAREARIECRFSVRETAERTFTVQVLNRSAGSRYVHTRSFETSVKMTVQRNPLIPAAKDNK